MLSSYFTFTKGFNWDFSSHIIFHPDQSLDGLFVSAFLWGESTTLLTVWVELSGKALADALLFHTQHAHRNKEKLDRLLEDGFEDQLRIKLFRRSCRRQRKTSCLLCAESADWGSHTQTGSPNSSAKLVTSLGWSWTPGRQWWRDWRFRNYKAFWKTRATPSISVWTNRLRAATSRNERHRRSFYLVAIKLC